MYGADRSSQASSEYGADKGAKEAMYGARAISRCITNTEQIKVLRKLLCTELLKLSEYGARYGADRKLQSEHPKLVNTEQTGQKKRHLGLLRCVVNLVPLDRAARASMNMERIDLLQASMYGY